VFSIDGGFSLTHSWGWLTLNKCLVAPSGPLDTDQLLLVLPPPTFTFFMIKRYINSSLLPLPRSRWSLPLHFFSRSLFQVLLGRLLPLPPCGVHCSTWAICVSTLQASSIYFLAASAPTLRQFSSYSFVGYSVRQYLGAPQLAKRKKIKLCLKQFQTYRQTSWGEKANGWSVDPWGSELQCSPVLPLQLPLYETSNIRAAVKWSLLVLRSCYIFMGWLKTLDIKHR